MTPTSEEVAWAAGFFEGEGTVARRKQGRFIAINNTDVDVLERFHAIVEVGVVRGPYGPYNDLSRKPIWTWSVSNAEGRQHVADLLSPWLSVRRCEQLADVADLLLVKT